MQIGDLVRHINLDEIFVVVDKPAIPQRKHSRQKRRVKVRVSVADHRGVRSIDVGFLEVINESR